MPKPVSRLRDMEIDEVSVVDKGAAQDGLIAIAKRATQEVDMPEEYFNEDGSAVDVDALAEGDIVYGADGTAYEYILEDEAPEAQVEVEQPELVEVGKSAFGKTTSFTSEIREELSKAFAGETNKAQAELFSKAAAEIDSLREQVAKSERIAKAERETRMIGEYVEVAKGYNIPGDAAELGPVLYRMAESMSYDDCAVIHKALTAAGATIFDEIGNIGGGDNADILAEVSKAAEAGGVDMTAVLDENPDAYAEYLRTK